MTTKDLDKLEELLVQFSGEIMTHKDCPNCTDCPIEKTCLNICGTIAAVIYVKYYRILEE